MGSSASKPTAEEEQRIGKKCAQRQSALKACLAANSGAAGACERLETALVMCYAAEIPGCKAAVAEHERCFTSLMNTGGFTRDGKRRGNCDPELAALKAGLKQRGLFPFRGL
jgi:hypothetical protein